MYLLISFIALQIISSTAFIIPVNQKQVNYKHAIMGGAAISPLSMAQVALEAEPEGGEELTIIDSMPGCRMKNMGEDTETKSDDEDSTVYNFWFTATVEASLIKSVRNSIEKDASKEANFPGFRKGQIPPYAQPQITLFSMQESIIKTCESAVGAFGLKGLGGEDGDVDVKEDVKELSKGYNYKKANVDIEFTATFKGTYDSTKRKVDDNNDDDGIIDVETVTEEDVEKEASDAVAEALSEE